MLLEEEKYIIKCLSQYGALTKTQIHCLLNDKPHNTVEKIIKNLAKRKAIVPIFEGGYYALDRYVKPDQRYQIAVCVLLKFVENIAPMAHYPAEPPSQIFFLKENIGYEIVVLYEGEEHLTRLLRDKEDTRYIIVTPDISTVTRLALPDVPCLFATVENTGSAEPNVKFYTRGDDNG